jgi:hypothetical protein
VLSPYHQSRASGKVVDDGGVAVGVLEMDLQCKGEQLECEEDLGRAASLSWLCTRTPGCLDFIPVSNVCHHDDLLLDLDPPYRSHPPPSSLPHDRLGEKARMASSSGISSLSKAHTRFDLIIQLSGKKFAVLAEEELVRRRQGGIR